MAWAMGSFVGDGFLRTIAVVKRATDVNLCQMPTVQNLGDLIKIGKKKGRVIRLKLRWSCEGESRFGMRRICYSEGIGILSSGMRGGFANMS